MQYLQEGPRFLIAGAVLGCLGFLACSLPWLARMVQQMTTGRGVRKEEVPATVSDMVSVWDTTEARVFFGFELIAAILILLSWYPFKMRNSCCAPPGGCSFRMCGCCHLSWASFRQFGPPLGLVLVATVPSVKVIHDEACTLLKGELDCTWKSDFCVWNSTVLACQGCDGCYENSTFGALVLCGVHGTAAVVMFIGFLTAEAHVLGVKIPFTGYAPLRCEAPDEAKSTVRPGTAEYKWRLTTWWFGFIFYNKFCIWTAVLLHRPLDNPSRKMNFCSFLSEVIAGLAMLGNHAVIWYYSSERKWRGEVHDRIDKATHDRFLEVHMPEADSFTLKSFGAEEGIEMAERSLLSGRDTRPVGSRSTDEAIA